MKTQMQHFWSSHANQTAKNETFDWIQKTNPITPAELEKLKQKNPKLWGGFKLTSRD